jgi:hypothetical protein
VTGGEGERSGENERAGGISLQDIGLFKLI